MFHIYFVCSKVLIIDQGFYTFAQWLLYGVVLFRFGHGKGVHDGARIVLKQEIQKKQLSMDSAKLQNVANVVAFCERK